MRDGRLVGGQRLLLSFRSRRLEAVWSLAFCCFESSAWPNTRPRLTQAVSWMQLFIRLAQVINLAFWVAHRRPGDGLADRGWR